LLLRLSSSVWSPSRLASIEQMQQTTRSSKVMPFSSEPNELVRPVHNRMPVILRPEDEEQWLDASRTPFAKAKSVLKPYPDELMDAHDVSQIVNSAKYDGPECIQPVSDNEITSGRQLSLL
jgi:putative SOS response-associated peptidase YedK